jgi:hypothetical protein
MVLSLAKRIAAQIGTIFAWVYFLLDLAFDWIGRSTADDDARQLVNEKLPAFAVWLFSTPSWVPALCALTLTGWLIWLGRDMAAGAKVHSRSSAEPGAPKNEQVRHAPPAALPPTHNGTPDETDRDKEAKDIVVQFCRRHLYNLIKQESRSINLILRELCGPDSSNTIICRCAAEFIRGKFMTEPHIVAATKDLSYRNYTRNQLELLLVDANKLTVDRSIFISQAIREKNFNKDKAIEIATHLYDIRKEVKGAWTEVVANPTFDILQTSIGQNENSWGDLWMPKFNDP